MFGFLRFRRNIESYQPLSKEIIAHDLNVLPIYLHKWKLAKTLINELKIQRKQIELQEKESTDAKSAKDTKPNKPYVKQETMEKRMLKREKSKATHLFM